MGQVTIGALQRQRWSVALDSSGAKPAPYGPTAGYVTHMFDVRCQENGIEHWLARIKHP